MRTYFKDLELVKKILNEKTGCAYLNSSKTDIVCNCPYCISNTNKQHMYIGINDPIAHCFKCNKATTTFSVFKILSINPSDHILEGTKITSTFKIDTDCARYFKDKDKVIPSKVEENILSNNYQNKLDYLKNRISNDIIVDKIPNLILDVKNFLNKNHITLNDNNSNLIDILDEKYVGFITENRTILILRNIDEYSKYKRYYKINILNENTIYKDFYGFQTSFIKNTELNTILLTEGIFNILRSYKDDFMKEKYFNRSTYCAAALGSGFLSTTFSILNYLKITLCNLIIMSDIDHQPNDKMYRAISRSPFIKNFTLLYNGDKKDFGDKTIDNVKEIQML